RVLSRERIAVSRSRYDGRGQLVERSFFGTDGEPCLHADGYARFTSRYDGRGHLVEEAFFGPDGEPVLHREGYHKRTQKFDERGYRSEVAYYGTKGEPVLHRDGCARTTVKYDERGNKLEQSYFGPDGRPMRYKEGYARFTIRYDRDGNAVDSAYFDVDGRELRTQVRVNYLVAGGQGARLGLRPGDVLVSYDGQPVTNLYRFLARRRAERPTDKPRPLVLLRGGKRLTVHVSPGLLGANLGSVVVPTPAAPDRAVKPEGR